MEKELKIGDKVWITNSPAPNDKDVGKISTIVSTYQNSFKETVYTLDNPNRVLGCPNWTEKYLEKVLFEIGDLVKYKTGDAAYEVADIYTDGNGLVVRIQHLGSKRYYKEFCATKNLVKLKFKIGDKVEVLKGTCKGKIGAIKHAHCEGGIFYRLSNVDGIRFNEQNLKLVSQDSKKQPETILAFNKGDLVYIDPNEVESKENCYKLWEVIGQDISDISIECSTKDVESAYLVKSCLKKPVFRKGQFIMIGIESWKVEDVYFSMVNLLSYTIHNPKKGSMFYSESKLLEKIAEDSVANCKIAVESICGDSIIAKADKCIITSKLEENYGSKNQLQGKDAPERERNDERGSRIYGRKSKSAIKVGHLGYQKVIGRS